MTDKPASLSTLPAVPSQTNHVALVGSAVPDDAVHKVEMVEEEPYTIKCICNFSDDDGNTIYCETCDTWQHIDCFYPDNREEAIREDFAHSCAECKPRPLNRQKAIERTLRLQNSISVLESLDKKPKRPPSKSHKKKSKPNEIHVNGHYHSISEGKNGHANDHPPPSKKSKTSHRPSLSVSSQPSKRSPSYGTARANPTHPPSPATTPPDLPDDFQIHHYSQGFCSLYNDVPDAHNNAFASLAIPTALSSWLRDPNTMKLETGRVAGEVFQDEPANIDEKRPKLEVKDATRSIANGTTLRWRFLKSTSPIDKDVPLIELNGEIGFQKDYCANEDNLWTDLSSPLPFVFFHPNLPLYIDTRKEGSLARFVRRSCKPNAQLDTYLSGGSEYHFWLVSDRHIQANEQITLPWDFRLEKSVCSRWLHLLGLSDDDNAAQDDFDLDETEYTAISNWIDRILSEYGGCACDLDNNCAFARFHRQYLFGKNNPRSKKKSRKPRNHTISPTSTGHATNSRAASEGHIEESMDIDGRDESTSARSKPPSRDRTPLRQGSFDQLGILTEPTDRDKRKVAMVEDSFRRMEQQQQPPRKKKRVSDGTNASSSSRSKSRNGSVLHAGSYVDAGTSRSKSGSPASSRSPNLGNQSKETGFSPDESMIRPRHSSSVPRPVYCDASIQTDPVDGEWFSDPPKSPCTKKRIISLSKRLLNNRHRSRKEDSQKRSSLSSQPSTVSAMEVDSPTMEQKPKMMDVEDEVARPPTQDGDVAMADVPVLDSLPVTEDSGAGSGKIKTPDLRLLTPAVPSLEPAPSATTPMSATSSSIPSALTGTLPSPFASAINGVVANPSPVKKKLSLSDYTSRMNKSTKPVGGFAPLKSGLSRPEDIKLEPGIDGPGLGKIDGEISPSNPTAMTNGHS